MPRIYQVVGFQDGNLVYGLGLRFDGHCYAVSWDHRTRIKAIDTLGVWSLMAGVNVIKLYQQFQAVEDAGVFVKMLFHGAEKKGRPSR